MGIASTSSGIRICLASLRLSLGRFLQAEAFAAATGVVDVGILEREHPLETVLDEVETRAVEERQAFVGNHNGGAVRLERPIALPNFVSVVERIGKAGTAD